MPKSNHPSNFLKQGDAPYDRRAEMRQLRIERAMEYSPIIGLAVFALILLVIGFFLLSFR